VDEVDVAISKIFDRGKTTVPSAVRRKLGVRDGDKLLWIEDSDGKIYVKGVSATKKEKRFTVTHGEEATL